VLSLSNARATSHYGIEKHAEENRRRFSSRSCLRLRGGIEENYDNEAAHI
jgi:hypothetical protein